VNLFNLHVQSCASGKVSGVTTVYIRDRFVEETPTTKKKIMSDNDDSRPSQPEEKVPPPDGTINVKVLSSTGDEIFFKIKRSTKLVKLQGAYAGKVGKDIGSIRFLYDGNRINETDTPDSLGMEDNDTIDVMVEQVGGSA